MDSAKVLPIIDPGARLDYLSAKLLANATLS
jgi:hypothetical protein